MTRLHMLGLVTMLVCGMVLAAGAAPDGQRPDPSLAARELLMKVYQAQRHHRQANGRWASRIEDLKIDGLSASPLGASLILKETPEGYDASVEAGAGRRWHVRQDSRFWSD